MIEMNLSTALAFYGALIMAGALALWFFTEITVQRVHTLVSKQNLWRCAFCAFSYLDEEATQHSTCPRCASINSATDKHVREVQTTTAPATDVSAETPDAPRRNPSRRKRPGAQNRGGRRRR
jgi:phage FluMu protein Com